MIFLYIYKMLNTTLKKNKNENRKKNNNKCRMKTRIRQEKTNYYLRT
jgi:hypothetical protein